MASQRIQLLFSNSIAPPYFIPFSAFKSAAKKLLHLIDNEKLFYCLLHFDWNPLKTCSSHSMFEWRQRRLIIAWFSDKKHQTWKSISLIRRNYLMTPKLIPLNSRDGEVGDNRNAINWTRLFTNNFSPTSKFSIAIDKDSKWRIYIIQVVYFHFRVRCESFAYNSCRSNLFTFNLNFSRSSSSVIESKRAENPVSSKLHFRSWMFNAPCDWRFVYVDKKLLI